LSTINNYVSIENTLNWSISIKQCKTYLDHFK
jgi:hypothetical protein